MLFRSLSSPGPASIKTSGPNSRFALVRASAGSKFHQNALGLVIKTFDLWREITTKGQGVIAYLSDLAVFPPMIMQSNSRRRFKKRSRSVFVETPAEEPSLAVEPSEPITKVATVCTLLC